MTPKFDLIDRGFGTYELTYGKEVPMQLAVWIRMRMYERFSNQPMSDESRYHIIAFAGAECKKLIERDYIRYYDHLNTWVVTRPLFKWVSE